MKGSKLGSGIPSGGSGGALGGVIGGALGGAIGGTKDTVSAVAADARWLAGSTDPADVELRRALDEASGRDADEVALRRIWSRLAQAPDLIHQGTSHMSGPTERTRRFRWPWIVGASLAGAVAAMTLMLIGSPSGNRPLSRVSSGGSSLAQTQASRRDLDRSVLVAPATVRTARGESLHLALRGGTEVVVASESTLVLDENERPSVTAGEVRFHVPPQPPGRTFSVAARGYRVVVVGTRFKVRVDAAHAGVSVDEGVVEVWGERRLARLTAGQSWESPASAALEPAPAPVAPAASVRTVDVRAEVRADVMEAPRSHQPGHVLRLASASPRSGSSLTAPKPVAAEASARTTVAMAVPGVTAPSPAVSSSPSAGNAPGARPPVAPPAEIAPPSVAPALQSEVSALMAQAREAQVNGDARRALGLYRALAQRGGAAGENAEYEIGRVLREGLHQPREAVAVWRAYRSHHPRGLLRIESDISIIEALISVDDRTGALAEASDFVRRYPDGERHGEIAALAGDLLRERGDFADAVGAYDAALQSDRGRRGFADGAAFHRAVCLTRGDREAGLAAMRTYLQSYPAGKFRAEAQRWLATDGRAAAPGSR